MAAVAHAMCSAHAANKSEGAAAQSMGLVSKFHNNAIYKAKFRTQTKNGLHGMQQVTEITKQEMLHVYL